MPQPTPYNRVFSFTNDQTANPSTKTPGNQLDAELNNVLITLTQTLANLALIQRDDGALRNGSVGPDQLAASVNLGFTPPTVWAAATQYYVNGYVFVGANLYRCLISNVSSANFNTDLAAGNWLFVTSFLGPKTAGIDALNVAADQSIYFTGASTVAQYALTASGRAIGGLTTTGIPAITANGVATTRVITGTNQQITVTNGDGVAGNPTLSFPAFMEFSGITLDQGTYNSIAITGTSTAPTQANTVSNTTIATTAFVKTVRLDQMATPNTDVAWGTNKITGLKDPTSAQDAATKNYVDSVAQGLIVKPSVACATTANITLSGEQTIDGVVTSGSRVLVKNQATAANNGIYVSAAGAWTRASDMNSWAQVPQAFTFVSAGTVNGSTGWVCTSTAGGTLGTTAITFSQFSGAGTYLAGTNITLTGNTFSVSNSPILVTPNIGVATATSVNKLNITAPASGSTLTIADTKTLTVSNSLTLAGTDATTITFQGTDTYVGRATTDTLTNKTFDTAGAGNVFKIAGTQITANTGTGSTNVLATSPTLVTPALGVATATTINGLTISSSTGTLTIANAKTATVSNTLTLAGTDATTITFQGTDTYVGRATTDTLTNKTLTAPVINGGTATALTGLGIRSTGTGAFDLVVNNTENLTAQRALTFTLNDAARTVNLAGNLTLAAAFTTVGANSLTFTTTAVTALTLPTTGTLATLAGTETFINKTLTSPIMTSPTLGAATATSINKVTITAVATGSTLTTVDGTTVTFQGTDTYVGRATTDTLTNKTYDTAGTGNVFKINGTAISAVTGTGSVVLSASPALTGVPTAPTALTSDNSTTIATTAFVQAVVTGATSGVSFIGGQNGAITLNGGTLASTVLTVPRYDVAQTLTATQEAQARANIGLGALKNMFRNGTFDIWQRGATPSPAGGLGSFVYTADGWTIDFGGAIGSTTRVSNSRTGANTLFGLQITGIASCTDALAKQRIESYIAARGVGKNVTFQAWVFNNTGGSITPTITVNRCTAQDNWGATASELAATSLQACANGVWTQVAYTFALSSSAGNGIEVYLDFGNNFSSNAKSLIIAEADLQVTPNLATGLQSSPPLPEFRDIATETVLCQRYYEIGTQPEFYLGGLTDGRQFGYGTIKFAVTKRSAPSCTLSGWQYFSASANTSYTPSVLATTTDQLEFYNTSALTNWNGWPASGTWTASAEL